MSKKILITLLFAVFFFIGLQLEHLPGIIYKNYRLGYRPVKYISNNSYIHQSQYQMDIVHYYLDIDLDTRNRILNGTAEITGTTLNNKGLDTINLNFYDNMKIIRLLLNDNETDYKIKNARLSIPYSGSKDTFKIKIVYQGRPKRGGLGSFVFGEIDGRSVVYNLNEPNYASTWFPCNDLPSDKAMLDIKITNDASQTSVSNGKLVSVENKGTRKTYHWKTYYPISTYLICIYSAEYKNFNDIFVSESNDTLKLDYYAFPEHLEKAKIDFKDHPDFLKCFNKLFGEYPFMKEKYGVAEFLWQLGAMEHQTITGIGSNFVGGNNFFRDIYVHELAHHWWGNAVGPATWNDIWLNEGFATYSEALYAEYKWGEDALRSTILSKFNDNFYGILYEPGEDLFSSLVYDKGAWVVHMLRWEVGDSAFFKILKEYFNKYKFKSASTNDFKEVCEEVSGKELNKFFDQWIYKGDDQIKADYKWSYEKSGSEYKVKVGIHQMQNKFQIYHFPLEICIKGNGEEKFNKVYINQKDQQFEFILKNKPEEVTLDPNNWLLANFFVKD